MQYTKYMITTTHIYSQLRVEMAKLWDFPGIMHIVRECEQAHQLICFSCFSFPSKLGFILRNWCENFPLFPCFRCAIGLKFSKMNPIWALARKFLVLKGVEVCTDLTMFIAGYCTLFDVLYHQLLVSKQPCRSYTYLDYVSKQPSFWSSLLIDTTAQREDNSKILMIYPS